MYNRFQVDFLNLVGTEIYPSLVPRTFSTTKKIIQVKESASIASKKSNELLGMRQQGGVFTCVSVHLIKAVLEKRLELTGLCRWK